MTYFHGFRQAANEDAGVAEEARGVDHGLQGAARQVASQDHQVRGLSSCGTSPEASSSWTTSRTNARDVREGRSQGSSLLASNLTAVRVGL